MKFSDMSGRLHGLEGRLLEDELYQIVWEEIERNEMDPVAQARSIEEGGELNAKVRAAYIKHRLRRLKDQLKVEELAAKETIRQEKEKISRKEAEQKRKEAEHKWRLSHCKLCHVKFSYFNSNHSGVCRSCYNKLHDKTSRSGHYGLW